MATRRSRMKVLPNLGGRGNKETKPVTNCTGKDVKKDAPEVSKAVAEPSENSSSTSAKVEKQTLVIENQPSAQLSLVLEVKPKIGVYAIEASPSSEEVCVSEHQKNAVSSNEEAADDEDHISPANECSQKLEIKNAKNHAEAVSIPVSDALSSSPAPTVPARARVRLPKATPNLGSSRRGLGTSRPPEDDRIPARRPPPVQRLASLPELPTKPSPPVQCPVTLSEPPTKRPPPVQRVTALQEQTTNVPSVESTVERHTLSDDDNLATTTETTKNTSASLTTEVASHHPEQHVAPTTKRSTQEVVANKTKPPPPLPASSKPGRATERRQSFRGADRDEFAPKKKRTMKRDLPLERNKMTMQDLIYWNPTTNPMKYTDEADPEEANEVILSPHGDEAETTPAAPEDAVEGDPVEDVENDEEDAMPMPQVKIGPDGNIIIDEKSLVIETTASKKNVDTGDIVYEKSSNTTYSSYRKRRRAKVWSDRETTKFYRVLNSVGADFSMMTNFFPNRSRYELKLKFNREDRFNRELIDKAISDCHHFDISLLEGEDFDADDLGSETGSVTGSKRGKGGRRHVVEEDQENVDSSKTSTRGRKQRGRVSGRGRGAGKKRTPRRMSIYASDGSSEEEEEANVEVANSQPLSPSPSGNEDDSGCVNSNPLIFDLNNPLDANSTVPPKSNNKPIVIDDDESDGNTGEDYSIADGEAEEDEEEQDDEIQVLRSTPAPTRAGRQPKRPQLFATSNNDQNPAKKRHKPVTSASSPRPSPVVSNNPASILSRLALSPTAAESRLVFVPTRTPDQLIHVYMLSPVNASPTGSATNAASGNTTPIASPLLTRPAGPHSPGGVTTPVSTPMCYSVGSSPIIISPVHYPGIRSPPQALRITQKNFVPNLNAAGRRGRGRPPKTSILARALSSPPLFNQPAVSVRLTSMTPSSSQPPVSSPACATATSDTTASPALRTTTLPSVAHTEIVHTSTPVTNTKFAVTLPPLAHGGVVRTPVGNKSSTVVVNTNSVSGTMPLPSVNNETPRTVVENKSSTPVTIASLISRTITLPSVVPTGVARAPVEGTSTAITNASSASRTITLPSIVSTEVTHTPVGTGSSLSISESSVTNHLINTDNGNINSPSVTSLINMESVCLSDRDSSSPSVISVGSASPIFCTKDPPPNFTHSSTRCTPVESNIKVSVINTQSALNMTAASAVAALGLLENTSPALQTTVATTVTDQPALSTNAQSATDTSSSSIISKVDVTLPSNSR